MGSRGRRSKTKDNDLERFWLRFFAVREFLVFKYHYTLAPVLDRWWRSKYEGCRRSGNEDARMASSFEHIQAANHSSSVGD